MSLVCQVQIRVISEVVHRVTVGNVYEWQAEDPNRGGLLIQVRSPWGEGGVEATFQLGRFGQVMELSAPLRPHL